MRNSFFVTSVLFILIISHTSFAPEPISFSTGKEIKTIIIDAGHGGVDGGAQGMYSNEKQICLAIANRLGAAIENEIPGVKVVYTRTKDELPGGSNDKDKALRERARIANENNGDLFISIHVNYAPRIPQKEFIGYKNVTYYTYVGKGKKKKKVKKTKQEASYRHYTIPNPANGTETYIFDINKTEEKAEFAIEGQEFNNEEEDVKDIDYEDPATKAKALLWTKKFFNLSYKLADIVEKEFVKLGISSRGVKQRRKGIWVLHATSMPSILIETGFISNKDDEDFLNSEEGQKSLVSAIVKAVILFKQQRELPVKKEGENK